MNPSRLDLNLLKVFDAIMESRSVTLAASILGLSQPAVSNQLNRLREAFDDPLFVRVTDGMTPTTKAMAIAGSIRRSLMDIRACLEQVVGFDSATSDRTFKIYMADAGQSVLLPRVLERLGREAPSVNTHTLLVPPRLMRYFAREAGAVDRAVGYFEDFEGSFRQQVLFEEHYVGMVRTNHPTVSDVLTFEQFFSLPQLVYQPSGGGHFWQESAVDKVFAAANVQRRLAVRVSHAMGLASIVSNTNLLVVIPSRLAEACVALVGVRILALPILIPPFQVKQHWHERSHEDPGHRWLRGLFEEQFRSQPAIRISVD